MILESLEVNNFRNLSGKIFWGPGLNIIHGNNGQGKTNWLEAIHTLARTKSFRTQHLQESIRFNSPLATIRGRVSYGGDIHRELQIALHGNTKSFSVNGKREPLSHYIDHLYVIALTADELEVIRGMPDARRRFIDRGAAALQPSYVQTIADYSRVIRQKNRILQDTFDRERSLAETEDLIAPWNTQ